MNQNLIPKFLKDIDYLLLFLMITLIGIGIISIASAGVDAEGFRFSNEYKKQIVWTISGIFLLIFALSLDLSRLKDYMFFPYAGVMLLLVYTRLAGRLVNGARSWIGIGEYGIQPSEFAKIVTILFLAKYLDESEHEKSITRLCISGIIIGIPVLLILSQPDFGSALVFFPRLLAMIFIGQLDSRFTLFIVIIIGMTFIFMILPLAGKHFFPPGNMIELVFQKEGILLIITLLLVIVAILSTWGWIVYKKKSYFWFSYILGAIDSSILLSFLAHKVMKEYQIMRLMVFLNPNVDSQGAGWNIIQSVTAIGSGGFSGKGYLQGTQSHAKFIPQQSTDFIFSIIAEEWGFVGSVVLIILFALFFTRILHIVKTTKDRFSYLVCTGLLGMYFFHFMVNVGMAIGIMPITGIPLYFISYGGSSLWAAMMGTGFLLGISARRYRM
jgi:rod shape determining protein RodA